MYKPNIGIIGAGWIASKYLDAIYQKKIFNLFAISSRTKEKSIYLKKKYKIKKVFDNYKNMFLDENIDAYILLVSAENINTLIEDLIKNKKPFLTEKPIVLNYGKTKKLLSLLNKYKTKNMVAMNRRYYSIFDKGLKILKNKGKILGITIEGHERFFNINKKDYNNDVYKNWIYANSCHTIDLLRFFCGDVKKITSYNTKYKKRKSNFAVNIKFKNGAIGNYLSYWYSPGGWSVTVFGEGITLSFKPLENGVYYYKNMKQIKISKNINDQKFKEGIFYMLLDFKKLITNKKVSEKFENIQNHVKTLEIIKEIYDEK